MSVILTEGDLDLIIKGLDIVATHRQDADNPDLIAAEQIMDDIIGMMDTESYTYFKLIGVLHDGSTNE